MPRSGCSSLHEVKPNIKKMARHKTKVNFENVKNFIRQIFLKVTKLQEQQNSSFTLIKIY